jgi:hypothetical protein
MLRAFVTINMLAPTEYSASSLAPLTCSFKLSENCGGHGSRGFDRWKALSLGRHFEKFPNSYTSNPHPPIGLGIATFPSVCGKRQTFLLRILTRHPPRLHPRPRHCHYHYHYHYPHRPQIDRRKQPSGL